MTLINDDDEYVVKKDIVRASIEELISDWEYELISRKEDYQKTLYNYNRLREDIKSNEYQLRVWYDPNEDLYFYEKIITPTQERINRITGVDKE